MSKAVTTLKAELDHLKSIARKPEELASLRRSHDEAVVRIAVFLPIESARTYLVCGDAQIPTEERGGIPLLDDVSDEEIEDLRFILARSWLHIVCATHEHRKEDGEGATLVLNEHLTPKDEIPAAGEASSLDWLRLGVIALGEEVSVDCYAEFVQGICAHLKTNPTEGLLLDEHRNIRLFEENGQYIVR